MKNSLNLTTVILVLVLSAIACSWNRSDPGVVVNSNASAAATPEQSGEPLSSGAESQFAAAERLIAELYRQHDADKGPFRERKRAVIDKYFAKPLADMIWKNEQRPAGEMGAIEADPLYDAQDVGIKKFSVGKATGDAGNATLSISFESYGQKKTIIYVMVREGDAWKIADIKYPGGYTLLQNFREYEKNASNASDTAIDGDFAGKYRVGETSCTVKPVKMVYEVKWAKGSGIEYFFSKEGNIFESEEDKSGGRNEFRFDDDNHDNGTFIRADGKIFSVSRAK
jgi:hypothetical protein